MTKVPSFAMVFTRGFFWEVPVEIWELSRGLGGASYVR
ncbi:hypothetical protein SAMN06265375_1133 [Muriicola jejuensis]|nr:hypothetical protein SAMN06265375_1133 [Muriicola jejuensis]